MALARNVHMVYVLCIVPSAVGGTGGAAVALFTEEERRFAEAVQGLVFGNPFLPDRIALEKQALGGEWQASGAEWNLHPDIAEDHPNVLRLAARADALVESLRLRVKGAETLADEEVRLFEDLCFFHLYHRRRQGFSLLIRETVEGRPPPGPLPLFQDFLEDVEKSLGALPGRKPSTGQAAHLFACMFEIRRAFHHVFHYIVGRSKPAARLRAAVWESTFTHDLRRYWGSLFDRMGDFTTLVVGPTGTGKELVARAIAHSRYVPFDPGTRSFTADFTTLFFPLNLEALPENLVESELFGHRRGAFTGATEDRPGWLEACPRAGTVFLDEIGELGPTVQVKLLRVLQDRTFQRVGETRSRPFSGKILAATNRDPSELLRRGDMRSDFYYRICSDLVVVPSLRERLDDDPAELPELVRHIARRTLGEEPTALVAEVLAWIEGNLGAGYAWPGNVRELEQCVRNVLVRGTYRPPPPGAGASDPLDETLRAMRDGNLPAEDALRRYCTWVYARTGSYLETARRLGLDRRTVKAKVDVAWLKRLA
jgi:transcriptional regulator with AAA-type ATPase domain